MLSTAYRALVEQMIRDEQAKLTPRQRETIKRLSGSQSRTVKIVDKKPASHRATRSRRDSGRSTEE